ncbi:hypothetical protein IWQ60_001156 [Tieghemiomyces parasiticus]|uniref:Uncharacterized protein n=1 Tax=Tieghemiomyces parasiticus TaxID=78921 RepID=A0A9W8AH82_9FUNG|nr:hypothetical protein IWQ60_001156 [Tieghemiomyces parasiticus]
MRIATSLASLLFLGLTGFPFLHGTQALFSRSRVGSTKDSSSTSYSYRPSASSASATSYISFAEPGEETLRELCMVLANPEAELPLTLSKPNRERRDGMDQFLQVPSASGFTSLPDRLHRQDSMGSTWSDMGNSLVLTGKNPLGHHSVEYLRFKAQFLSGGGISYLFRSSGGLHLDSARLLHALFREADQWWLRLHYPTLFPKQSASAVLAPFRALGRAVAANPFTKAPEAKVKAPRAFAKPFIAERAMATASGDSRAGYFLITRAEPGNALRATEIYNQRQLDEQSARTAPWVPLFQLSKNLPLEALALYKLQYCINVWRSQDRK